MMADIYMSPSDLDVYELYFEFTCPHCGCEQTAYTRESTFHKEFECEECGKMVDIYCEC